MAATPVAIVGDHLDRPSEAELATAIAVVVAMSDDEFFDAADRIGLDPFSGMRRGRRSFPTSTKYIGRST